MKNLFCALTLIFSIITYSIVPPSAFAAQEHSLISTPLLPNAIDNASVQLIELAVDVYPGEFETKYIATYKLNNISSVKTTLHLETAWTGLFFGEPQLVRQDTGEIISSQHYNSGGTFSWDIDFAANENIMLEFLFNIIHPTTKDDLVYTGIAWAKQDASWYGPVGSCSVLLHFSELPPGLFTYIEPQRFDLTTQGINWSWEDLPDSGKIDIRADLTTEKSSWKKPLNEEESALLQQFLLNDNYRAAAFCFQNAAKKASRDDRTPLKLGQAYYLNKSGSFDKALAIWEELFQDSNSFSPVLLWNLANYYSNEPQKLKNIYNRVREFMIDPLLQQWLCLKLEDFSISKSPPEILSQGASVDELKAGINLTAVCSDPDGDIEQMTLFYRLADQDYIKIELKPDPFSYTQAITHLVPMQSTMQNISYYVYVSDRDQHVLQSGPEDFFYMSKEIASATYSLRGAKLVLGEYAFEEQIKYFDWFNNYMETAGKTGFIPVEGKMPLFILLGKDSPLIEDYQGPFFFKYFPGPFSPEYIKAPVQRYYLAYWYGEGWSQLEDELFFDLTDALIFDKGSYARLFKYLQNIDPLLFQNMLYSIGEGNDFETALLQNYKISLLKARIACIWSIYGNNFLALVLIFTFTWAAKTGLFNRLIRLLHR